MKIRLHFIILSCLVILFSPIVSAQGSKGKEQEKYNFNSQWLLHVGEVPNGAATNFKDSSWKKITLPRAFNEDEAFKVPIDSLSTSILWYRKYFKIPKQASGKKVFLEFEGIRFAGEVYVNGKAVGIHENGVMAFGLDITDYLNTNGKANVVALRIDNSWKYKERTTHTGFQWNDKNFNANYGGIPKNVFLHIKDRVYQTLPLYNNLGTTGTYVYAKQININKGKAIIHAESEVKNEHKTIKNVRFEVKVEDMDGKLVKTFTGNPTAVKPGQSIILSAENEVEELHFWSWGYGYLYKVNTILYVDDKPIDVVETRTGFRKKLDSQMV